MTIGAQWRCLKIDLYRSLRGLYAPDSAKNSAGKNSGVYTSADHIYLFPLPLLTSTEDRTTETVFSRWCSLSDTGAASKKFGSVLSWLDIHFYSSQCMFNSNLPYININQGTEYAWKIVSEPGPWEWIAVNIYEDQHIGRRSCDVYSGINSGEVLLAYNPILHNHLMTSYAPYLTGSTSLSCHILSYIKLPLIAHKPSRSLISRYKISIKEVVNTFSDQPGPTSSDGASLCSIWYFLALALDLDT